MTGLWLAPDRVEVASGSGLGGSFSVREWSSRRIAPEETTESAVAAALIAAKAARRHVAVVVPADRLTVRTLELPTQSESEILSMVPYQLAQELPVDLTDVAWTATLIERLEDGSSVVRIEIVRRDLLDAWLAPVRRARATVWAAIPESEVIARRITRAIPARHPRAFLVEQSGALHFLVERGGVLLFHRRLPRAEPGELRGALEQARKQTGRDLPTPVSVLATSDDQRAAAAQLAEAAGVRALPVAAPEPESDVPLAQAVASLATERGAGLLPRDTQRRLAQAALRRAFARTASIVAGAVVLFALFLAADLYRTERRVEILRGEVAAAQARVDEVDRMRGRLEELAAPDLDTEVLRVIAGLQAALSPQIRVQTLRYSRDGRVAFVGTSPGLGLVDALEEALEADALWSEVKILRMQRADGAYRFEIEATLARREA